VRRMPLTLLFLLSAVAASVTLAGCSAPNGPPGPTGTVIGSLQAVGGPPGARPEPLSGDVTLQNRSGAKAVITVGASGRFSVPASTGTYTVSGQSPGYDGGHGECRASAPITVSRGATSRVKVDCQEM